MTSFKREIAPQHRKEVGLQKVFKEIFPISDTRDNYSLEFVSYALGEPKYTIDECQERDVTFAAPLKATLRLIVKENVDGRKEIKDIIEQEVYLGELPLITEKGTFVINGAERVIVSQLHRSPGVFFDESIHPNGKRLFSARIIPVSRFVGRVHHRHQRHHVRPHRPEAKDPGHRASAGHGFLDEPKTSLQLFYDLESVKVQRAPRRRTKDLRAACTPGRRIVDQVRDRRSPRSRRATRSRPQRRRCPSPGTRSAYEDQVDRRRPGQRRHPQHAPQGHDQDEEEALLRRSTTCSARGSADARNGAGSPGQALLQPERYDLAAWDGTS